MSCCASELRVCGDGKFVCLLAGETDSRSVEGHLRTRVKHASSAGITVLFGLLYIRALREKKKEKKKLTCHV